ncbi:MAG: hypothetical protein FWD52_08620, partial [Candidatus Bathyarchaeota archaeon]|nr:hypothetical protein [Candidatus Termiticorpusculum sp.]
LRIMPFFTTFSDKHFLHVTIIDNLTYKITTNLYISLLVKTLKKTLDGMSIVFIVYEGTVRLITYSLTNVEGHKREENTKSKFGIKEKVTKTV